MLLNLLMRIDKSMHHIKVTIGVFLNFWSCIVNVNELVDIKRQRQLAKPSLHGPQ